MAYQRDSKLIMTIVPTTMGDDTAGSIGTAIGSIVNALKGGAAATTPPTTPATGGGIDMSTLLLLGALGVGGYFVYKKMKKRR